MKPIWCIADLIDFEYLLLRDDILVEENGQDALKHRDRDIFLQKIAPVVEGQGELNQSFLLHSWLKVRQHKEAEKTDGIDLPGRYWSELYMTSWVVLLPLGLITGAIPAFSFLSYSGAEPVNVSMYLAIFVGLQILLLGVLGVAFLCRLLGWFDLRSSVLYRLLSGLMVRGMLWLHSYAKKKMTGQQRMQISAAQGLLRKKIKTHGSCFFWPLFTLVQMFGIGLNSGVLGATLLKVSFADMAFSWQSSLPISKEGVFMLIKFIALPWSWFVPENYASPSFMHIEGTHTILKEGILNLATKDLVSWWPFLCLAVLFYGLLPRIVLLFVGLSRERCTMSRLQFKGVASRQLLLRMTSSLICSQSPMPGWPAQPLAQGLPHLEELGETRIVGPDDLGALHTAIALIPDELYEQCFLDTLQTLMQKRLGATVQKTLRTGETNQDEQVVLNQIEAINSTSKIESIVVLQEAWQPPILEFFYFLKKLRSRLGADVPLFVALVGKPGTNTIFTPIKKEDLKIWRQKIMAMGEPDIQILDLVVAP
jgi:hypothetical protein